MERTARPKDCAIACDTVKLPWEVMGVDHQDYYRMAEEEERQERRDHLRFAAGMSDFVGVILGAVVILIMVLLILSLVNWLRQDIQSTFALLGSRFQ